MFDVSRYIISLAWTHSCQRSRDLCRSSPAPRGAVSSERVAPTACSRPAQLRKLSVNSDHCRLGRWQAADAGAVGRPRRKGCTMRDSLKIALGIILGVLGLAACSVCALLVLGMGGLSLISGPVAHYTPSDLTPTTARMLPPMATSLPLLPTSTATAIPTPTATPIPPFAVGESAQWDGLSIAIISHEVTHTCPSGDGKPAEGAKFIIIYVQVRNTSSDVIEIPSFQFELNSYQSGLGAALPCRYSEEAFGNACWQWSGKLYPGVSCEGWELFEVPENTALQDARVRVYTLTPRHNAREWRLQGQ